MDRNNQNQINAAVTVTALVAVAFGYVLHKTGNLNLQEICHNIKKKECTEKLPPLLDEYFPEKGIHLIIINYVDVLD